MINWKENFVSYEGLAEVCYIYCDTNASYASIHQHLQHGFGKPCVVANGNVSLGGNAGACLAISYEARNRGLRRGSSLIKAKSLIHNLTVYESCLPLYEMYSDLYDKVLEWIIPKSFWYRGSCDEVVIKFSPKAYPFRCPRAAFQETVRFIKEKCGVTVPLHINEEQRAHAKSLSVPLSMTLALCYLIRDTLKALLGLPISIAVAPSICLAKALIDQAKPVWSHGGRHYSTIHDAISFPLTADEANAYFKKMPLVDLCGVRTVARRMAETSGIRRVSDVQSQCGLDRTIRLAQNKHLGEVIWYNCHGRDDVLGGYLSAIRDRR